MNEFTAIKARRAAIETELAEHRKAIAELEEKLRAFDIVAVDMEGNALFIAAKLSDESTPIAQKRRPRIRLRDKPSYPHMILDAANIAVEADITGFEPSEYVSYVEKRYGSRVPAPKKSIPPTVWSLWKRGILEKYGDLYGLPGLHPPEEHSSDSKKAEARMMRLLVLDDVKPLEPTEGLSEPDPHTPSNNGV
jgi:hypothetical protein